MAEDTQDTQPQTQDPAPETDSDEAPKLPDIGVDVADAGTLKKKVTVTIPRKRIDAKYDDLFGELAQSAQVPGFRIGRAPRKLIEKRFGKEIAQDVRNGVIGESLSDAIEKADLKTIGEPDLDLEKMELPESGDMTYDFEIEVQPEFELPETKGVKVNKTAHEVTDERVDEYVQSLAESRATYEPSDGAAAAGDLVLAGATITGDGIETVEKPGLQLRVAPGQVEGLPLVDLGEQLAGKKADDTVDVSVTAPASHPNEQWQGKQLTVALTISEVRTRKMPAVDDAFAASAGFDSLDALKQFIAQQMTSRMAAETQREMREQISQYLLDSVQFDLPEGLVTRQTANVLQRRYIDLLHQGVPRERIDESITELKAAAGEQAQRALRLSFITARIAETENIEVTEDEINARIAQMAAMSQKRPERLKQELNQDGSIAQVENALLDEKVLDKLLAEADITEVKEETEKKKPARKAAKKKSAKKAAKKAKGAKAAETKPAAKKAAKKKTAKKAAKKSSKKE